MCLMVYGKDRLRVATSKGNGMSSVHSTSSFNRLLRIMKPKLPRNLTKSPRINLNKYWSVLEELVGGVDSGPTFGKNFVYVDETNEIKDNIMNETKERNSRGEEEVVVLRCLQTEERHATAGPSEVDKSFSGLKIS